MGPLSFSALSLVFALAAQDAGPEDVDAGPDVECDPTCDGDVLHFCDADAPAELDCRTLGAGARCALISSDWGLDCVLGAGAACDPGYAFGASRCDPGASLVCVDGECTQGTRGDKEPREEPTPGTEIPIVAGSTNPFGCPSCGDGQAALLAPALLALRGLRSLRTRSRSRSR